jgi:ABC-2 type transport system permease protein
MSTIAIDGAVAPATESARPLSAFTGMLLRDLRVVIKQWPAFLSRTVMQPLLTVFVFAYVFPKIGQSIGGAKGAAQFSTLLAPGMVAFALIFQGIQAVALPLVQEFGYTREIDDRVLAPLPVWAVGLEKIVSGALQALLAAIIVFPILYVVPATPVHLHVSWLALLSVAPLACMLAGSLGLALGTRVEPRQVALMFSIIVLPMSMLGCVYYPWQRLDAIKWLKYVVLINPLVYMSEGFRGSLTNIAHMPWWGIYLALCLALAILMRAGLRGFAKRVLA